jgi:hypothetical protein
LRGDPRGPARIRAVRTRVPCCSTRSPRWMCACSRSCCAPCRSG